MWKQAASVEKLSKGRKLMKRNGFRLLLMVLLVFGMATAQDTKEVAKKDTTEREKFDPQRNPAKDVRKAVAIARKTGKRILLDVGGEWCSWCHKLDKFFQDNKDVSEFMQKNFVIVKVNYSKENKNEKFLSKYPKIPGYPHLFVLGSTGKFLHSQGSGDLESGDHHDHDKVFDFLKKWAPKQGS
jgi:thioredoxin-related protein